MGCSKSSAVLSHNVQVLKTTQAQSSELIVKIQSKTPSDQLAEYLKELKSFSKGSKSSFETAFETLNTLLKNISSHFEDQKFRKIRKKNKKFEREFGRFKGINNIMRFLGFHDTGDSWQFIEELGKSHVQMRLVDLSLAYNKILE